MGNKDYENRNQDYGNYHNKDYCSSKGDESKSHIPGSIIFFIIVSALAGVIALDKLDIEAPFTPVPNTAPKTITTKSLSDSTKSGNTSNNNITEKDCIEFEKRIDSADLETINSISLSLKKLIKNKTEELNKSRDNIKADNTRTTEEKLREFKLLQKEHNILKQSVEKTLSMIAKRRAALEKSLKIKNISNYYKMNEQQLKDELYDYLSGNYTYKRIERDCSQEEVQKEFIWTFVSKNNANLLDELLTKCSEKNLLVKNDDYYNEVYHSLYFHKLNCFEVFVKHGIDVNKVHDKNNIDNGIMHLAASKGLIPTIQLALDNGIPIDQRTYSNSTPLYLAIKNDQYETVEFLINNGALAQEKLEEYNNYGNILYYPVRNNNIKMLDLLAKSGIIVNEDLKIYTNDRKILRFILSKGQMNNETEVDSKDKEWEKAYNCIKEGNLEQLKELVSSGKDLSKMYYDGEPAICIAVAYDKPEIVEYLVKKYDCKKLTDSINGRNALHYAAMGSSIKIMDILLKNGFDPNEPDNDKNTPINFATCCNYNKPNFAKNLLEKGANPNLLNNNNQNSLFFLTNINYHPLFKLLLDKGAYINQQDIKGNTPLHHFLLKSPERYKFIASFLEKQAYVNAVNEKQQTPLHLAVLSNDNHSVFQLLKAKANINQQDIDGNTALHYVAKYAPNKIMMNEIYRSCFGNADMNIKNNEGETPLDIEPNCFYQSDFKNMLPSKE
ncbi:MAG: ankyrin repeat domain-containing protein [Candidatus Riflebacteria bacterium]|nr:ankyrin repeat domain-containing protein [Candidatus Riflebacteria bacterium]